MKTGGGRSGARLLVRFIPAGGCNNEIRGNTRTLAPVVLLSGIAVPSIVSSRPARQARSLLSPAAGAARWHRASARARYAFCAASADFIGSATRADCYHRRGASGKSRLLSRGDDDGVECRCHSPDATITRISDQSGRCGFRSTRLRHRHGHIGLLPVGASLPAGKARPVRPSHSSAPASGSSSAFSRRIRCFTLAIYASPAIWLPHRLEYTGTLLVSLVLIAVIGLLLLRFSGNPKRLPRATICAARPENCSWTAGRPSRPGF